MNAIPESIRTGRDRIARTFLGGRGIEIGPGNAPIRFSSKALVDYVDFASKEDLVNKYGVAVDWIDPDIIDDAETLSSISESSVDFIVACHVLEHTQNPLKVLETWFSRLRPEGVVFIAIPDRAFSFDRDRPLTSFEHLLADYRAGPQVSENAHLHEWITVVDGIKDDADVRRRKRKLKKIGYKIHYHVWNTTSFAEMLTRCNGLVADFDIEHCGRNDTEAIAVLRKRNGGQSSTSTVNGNDWQIEGTLREILSEAQRDLASSRDDLAAERAKRQLLEAKLERNVSLIENLQCQAEEIPFLKDRLGRFEKDRSNLAERLNRSERELASRYSELAQLTRALVDEEERSEKQRGMAKKLLRILQALHQDAPSWWPVMSQSRQWQRLSRRLASQGLFDAIAYADQFPDVVASGQDPLRHYLFHGIEEIEAGKR